MNSINRKAVRPALLRARCWRVLLAFYIVSIGCGGKDQQDASSTLPGPEGIGGLGGGSTVSSGGAGLGGMQESTSSTAGDAMLQAGSAGSGQINLCPLGSLAVAMAIDRMVDGQCFVSSNPSYSETWGPPWGTITLDSEGRLLNNLGPAFAAMSALSAQGWTCLQYAGVTLTYWCVRSI